MNKELYEERTYEILCSDCSKSFQSKDEDEILCADCWNKRAIGMSDGQKSLEDSNNDGNNEGEN